MFDRRFEGVPSFPKTQKASPSAHSGDSYKNLKINDKNRWAGFGLF